MSNQLIEEISDSDLEAVTGGKRVQDACHNMKSGYKGTYQGSREVGEGKGASAFYGVAGSMGGALHGLAKRGRYDAEDLKPGVKDFLKK